VLQLRAGSWCHYRVIQEWRPTLLVDEADTFLKNHEELGGVINSGHTKETARVLRVNRETGEVEFYSTWAPKAIALIGNLHSTLQDRSIHIKMARRTQKEPVNPLRKSRLEEFQTLSRKILRWTNDHRKHIETIEPKLPAILNDRAADNWLPLLAIAQVAGGDWPHLTLNALASFNAADDGEEDTIVIALLLSLRDLFRQRDKTNDDGFLATEEILKALNFNKEAPWADWNKGNGISAKKLKSLVKSFDIKPVQIQREEDRPRGYRFRDLRPVFERYLNHDGDSAKS